MCAKPELLIEVYTDPMCPWCWIGHARLEQTLSSKDFEDLNLNPIVKLRPYILDPTLPATSFDPPEGKYEPIESTPYKKGNPPTKKEYYSKKFTNFDAFDAKISKAASDAQLSGFEWLTEGKVGATFLAHRLLWYALQLEERKQNGANGNTNEGNKKYSPTIQEQLVSELYTAFHKDSQDLSDTKVLSRIATEAQIFSSEEEAKKWLESDEGEYEVNQAINVGLMNGVQSVPFLIVQDGSDHSSEVMDHESLMRMFKIQASALG